MIPLRTFCFLAATLILGTPDRLLAEPPEEAELLLLRVRVKDGSEIESALDAYLLGGRLYLPVVRLAEVVEMPFELSPDGRELRIRVPERARPSVIDFTRRGAEADGRPLAEELAAFDERDEAFVRQDQVEALLAVAIEVDVGRDLMTIRSAGEVPLPVEERLRREAQWRRFEARAAPEAPDAVQEIPYALFAPMMGDITLTGRRGTDGTLRFDYQGYLVGELGYLTHELFVGGSDERRLGDLRLASGRRDYRGGVFGVASLREAVAGDIVGHAAPLIGSGVAGRGLRLTGAPLTRATGFDETVVEGDAPPGWDAELYRGEELLAIQRIGPDGRYRFEDVVLNFGRNLLRVVLYGPQGQTREIEELVNVGIDMVPPGGVYWAAYVNQPDTRLFDSLLDRRSRYGKGAAGAFLIDAGVTPNLSIGGFATRAPVSRRRGSELADYVGVVLRPAYGPVALEVAAVAQGGGGRSWRLAGLTGLGPVSLSLRHEEYLSGYRSLASEFGTSPLRRFSRVSVHTPLSYVLQGLGSLSVTGDRYELRSGRKEHVVRPNWRFSTAGLHFDHGLEYRRIRNPHTLDFNRTLYAGTASLFRGPVGARASLRYRLTDDPGLESYAASLRYRVSADTIFSAGISRDHRFKRTSGNANVSWDLGFAFLNLGGTWHDDSRFSVGLGLSFSFGFDSRARPQLSSRSQARYGAVEPFVFFDRAGDGVYDPEIDEPLPDTRLLVNRYPVPGAETDEHGSAYVGGLSPDRPARIGIDPATLPDAFFVPAREEIVVQPRPGRVFRLPIAVVESGEISGTVEGLSNGDRVPLPGFRLELVDEAGRVRRTARSMFDGFYLFEHVPPGRWIVRSAAGQHIRGIDIAPFSARVVVASESLFVEGLDVLLDVQNGIALEPLGEGCCRQAEGGSGDPVLRAATGQNAWDSDSGRFGP